MAKPLKYLITVTIIGPEAYQNAFDTIASSPLVSTVSRPMDKITLFSEIFASTVAFPKIIETAAFFGNV
jgi:hypothetical protein